ncbi:MAG: hypothetical protein ACT4OK_02280 [Gemmobacter sp.]
MVRLLLFLLCLAVPALAEGNLKLTILVDPGTPHPVVGEMVNITIRGVYDRKVAIEKLEIDPTDAFDWIQTTPDDWHEEMIDGLSKIVVERHIAVWPKRAGLLQFGPARHRLTVIDKESRRQDALVTAQPLALSVGEFPDLHGWHLSARALELTDELSVDPAQLADGQSVTRKVRLRALGALPEHLPPRPVIAENWLITFAAPVERTLTLTADGPVAEAIWTWQFRPHTGEPGILEPVSIPWFNTTTRKLETVEIPALPIGFASFYTGQTPTGRFGILHVWGLGAALVLGAAAGLGFAAIRLAPETTAAGWRRLRRRFSPFVWAAYLRARRAGDLLAQRRLGEDIGLPPARLRALERAIFAPRAERQRGR